jgi:flagellar basal-body rod protein FlgB
MNSMLDKEIGFHQTALNVRAYRQQLLASNMANADTPHYKARDVDFKSALNGALSGRLGHLALASTSARHLQGDGAHPLDGSAQFRSEEQSSVDGNTVNMDVERSAFAENAVQYEASITFINGLLRTMQQAVQGQ